ncbi:hypothetical protein BU204_02850 [Actinophytocola xanthii]|uniref:Uncharacterized protein n=1 Tax=Actinophytocola xanthii TaxID=1912961 RepID=A0A1Q8CYB1_9PSEU|nr:hypothetical protein BU204_02850 [Actinophytocola xanthii]
MAAVAAIVIFGGGGGVVGGGALGSSAGGAAQSTLARNLGAKKADAKSAARRGDTRSAWQRMGLRQLRERAERYGECVTHSTGQVQRFLASTPCRRLDRLLVVLGDGSGNVAVVAVAWVEFRGRAAAGRYLGISDDFGTGYVRPIGGVELTGQHYDSRVAGAVAVTAEAEPATGLFDDRVLDAIAEVAAWIPRR